MYVLAVVNLKGGTGKTTTSVFTAHVLAELGLSTLLVDTDPQGSALRWSEQAEEGEQAKGWPFPAVALPTRTVHSQLAGITGDRYEAVVIDTPPLNRERDDDVSAQGIVLSVLRVATHVVIPLAPTPIEYERLARVRDAIAAAADLRPDGQPPTYSVLLNRTVAGASSTEAYREAIEADGDQVLKVTVGRLERYAQSYGDPVDRAASTAYGDVVAELLDASKPAAEPDDLDTFIAEQHRDPAFAAAYDAAAARAARRRQETP